MNKYRVYMVITAVCLAIGMKTAVDTPLGRDTLTVDLVSSHGGLAEVFYDTGDGFSAQQRVQAMVPDGQTRYELVFDLPQDPFVNLRWDPVYHPDGVRTTVYDIRLSYYGGVHVRSIGFETLVPQNDIATFTLHEDSFEFTVDHGHDDPYFIFTRIPERPEKPSQVWLLVKGLGFSLLAAVGLSLLYRMIVWYFNS